MSNSSDFGERAWRTLSWLRTAWTDAALAGAVMLAAGTATMLFVAGNVWRTSAENKVAETVAERTELGGAGVDIAIEATFDLAAIEAADAALRSELGLVPDLAPASRTLYTLPITGTTNDSIVPRLRLVAQAGSREAVQLISSADARNGDAAEASDSDGAWISSWLAENADIGLGDELSVEAGALEDTKVNDVVPGGGSTATFVVTGIYQQLWTESDDPVDGYWTDVPPVVVPRYNRPFSEPNFSLVLIPEAELASSSISGFVRWTAAAEAVPSTLDGMRDQRDRLQSIETSLVSRTELGEAMTELGQAATASASLDTTLYEAVAEADAAARLLGPPIRAARSIGTILGVAFMAMSGLYFVDRRRLEFRLLAGDGEQWPKLAARTGAQLAGPVAFGAGLGCIAGAGIGRLWGMASFDLGLVPWLQAALVALTGLIAASVVTGVRGQRQLLSHRAATSAALLAGSVLMLAGFAVALWFVVAQPSVPGMLGIESIALPVVALAAVSAIAVSALGPLSRMLAPLCSRRSVSLTLAIGRVGSASAGSRLATGSVGVALGLLVFSSVLVSTLDRAVAVRTATTVGGVSQLELVGLRPADFTAPADSTQLAIQQTTITPGDELVRVVAVDDSWVDIVEWPDEFGMSPGDVHALLQSDSTESLPVVAIRGEGVPTRGAFGSFQPFPFRVVGRTGSLPLAGEFGATIMVSASKLDQFAIDRAVGRGEAAPSLPPTRRSRVILVSSQPLMNLEASIANAGYQTRDGMDASALLEAPRIIAARAAYDFLGLLGLVGALCAGSSLALHRSSVRRSRALTRIITESMGMSRQRHALISVLEASGALALSTVVALLAVGPLVAHLAPRFDPSPGAPPAIAVHQPGWNAWVALGLILLVLLAGIWFAELLAARKPRGEAIRDGNN